MRAVRAAGLEAKLATEVPESRRQEGSMGAHPPVGAAESCAQSRFEVPVKALDETICLRHPFDTI